MLHNGFITLTWSIDFWRNAMQTKPTCFYAGSRTPLSDKIIGILAHSCGAKREPRFGTLGYLLLQWRG